MLEIARSCYLEDVLFAEADSVARNEICQFVESVGRLSPEEMVESVNTHMSQRMFLVGENITAADVVVFSALAPTMSAFSREEKLAKPHAFRWIDHVQHLPGMLEQVQGKGLFTGFPEEEEDTEGMSKSQLKKMAKAKAQAEAKANKAKGADGAAPADGKQK